MRPYSYYDEAVKTDPNDGFWKRADGDWELMLHHELKGVTVPMIYWWFDNIDTIERYKLWDPDNHLAFKWIVDPHTNGHVGAIHQVLQKIGGIPLSMSFRYTEPQESDRTPGYDHIITADCCGLLFGKIIPARYIIEWKETDYGILMCIRYVFAGWAPASVCKAVYNHDYPEQKRLPGFLPKLYQENQ